MTLPFPALIGLETAQQALLLLAIEPRLRGVVIAAPVGSGKSSLARSLHALSNEIPFVELPLGADEDALLGGLDIEATLRHGRRTARPGLLARADGGIVFVDQLNLLADGTANLLMAALEQRSVAIEREGLSLRSRSDFHLVGSYDPAEGMPRRHLLDRVGLLVVLPPRTDTATRAEVLRHNLVYDHSRWDDELALLRGLILAAREQLPNIQITADQISQLVAACSAFGVEGHRADAFAVHTARAAAALALRDSITHEDLELAVRLVILPRATRQPAPPEAADPPPPPPPPDPQPPADDSAADTTPPDEEQSGIPEEQILSALASELPAELEALPFRAVRRGRSGSRGSTLGRRGRHIRSIAGDPRRARIDIAATLRAAAPWQQLRGSTNTGVQLRNDDLRVKQYRAKAGALFLFAVDASGSMALNRMRQAKGAVQTLLQRAYVHRDRVALLAFRGRQAELLLPPSQSVELAQRALDTLPTGGGTPLAAALLTALDTAQIAHSRGIHQTVVVLLTDGRANVPLGDDRSRIDDELQAIGHSLVAAGVRSIVVDTQRSYLSRGEARRLAGWLGGEYVYLPNASGSEIADAATAAV